MTILSGPRSALPDVVDVVSALQRSNHATAVAAWTMTTIAIGFVFQAGTVETVAGSTDGALFVGALVAVIAATVRVLVLLHRARYIVTLAQEEMYRFCGTHDAPEAGGTWRLLESLVAATATRETLTRQALAWACGAGVSFLAWSVIATLAVSGH
jgi:hypothetical protein